MSTLDMSKGLKMSERGPCHDCGHSHPTMASASRRGEQRWFCHADDHSCYMRRAGNYFNDDIVPLSWRDSFNVPKELEGVDWETIARLNIEDILKRARLKAWGNTEIPATFAARPEGAP